MIYKCDVCSITISEADFGACDDAGACLYRYYIRVRHGTIQNRGLDPWTFVSPYVWLPQR